LKKILKNIDTEIVRKTTEKLLKSPIISKLPLQERYKRRIAFTLAEVLITLLIIGVVASLVVPALINETNKVEYVTKLKKESAVLQQAFKLLALDAGGSILNNPNFNCSGSLCETTTSANAMNDFATKLNVIKNCGNSQGCLYASPRKNLGGSIDISNLDSEWNGIYGKAIWVDGTMMTVNIYNSNCTNNTNYGSPLINSPLYHSICGDIGIDINGESGPNQRGRDYFNFWITKTGIYPRGIYNDGFSCDINSSNVFTSSGCTAKVLSEGAMNY